MTSWSFHWKYPTYGKILLLLKRYAPREKNGDHMHICLDSSVIVTALRRQEKDHVPALELLRKIDHPYVTCYS
ncbi:MAG: hypothetical protein KK926_05850 [Methanomethylovorans sp.]|nr:hypothetical protein [Methanomethylovorans sp.]